jgi:hypothetical protein
MPDETKVWEIRLGVHATRQDAEQLTEQISRLLCPDPDHAPPCPIPWTIGLVAAEGEDGTHAYPELVEQAQAERDLYES